MQQHNELQLFHFWPLKWHQGNVIQIRQLRFGESGVTEYQQGNYFATQRVSARQKIPQQHCSHLVVQTTDLHNFHLATKGIQPTA
jgi:hypothetical protein